LYVANESANEIDIFSRPSYQLVGHITQGVYEPEGIATDTNGDLYVTNLGSKNVTVYHKGATTPYRTLTLSFQPDDVAVTADGYVAVSDVAGGVDVYAPGASAPTRRLTSQLIANAAGCGVDAQDNVFVSGNDRASNPVVVEYKNLMGPGANLGLSGLVFPSGVIVDKSGALVVSDNFLPGVDVYAPGSKSPTTIVTGGSPNRSALNKTEHRLYVPESSYGVVNVYSYPGGALLKTISFSGSGNFISGTALSPAPPP
jgi:serine/threonine-protein kinase